MNDTAAPLEATARGLVQRLRDAGFEALYAGGCVRDLLLGQQPKDYDVATSAAKHTAKVFLASADTGIAPAVIAASVLIIPTPSGCC